jgi:uncharacterized protein YuzB (UPF0349 family)
MALVEYCLSNVSVDARVALDNSDHEVRETICLDRCGDCHRRPFLVVDSELRTGDSHRELLRSIEDECRVTNE